MEDDLIAKLVDSWLAMYASKEYDQTDEDHAVWQEIDSLVHSRPEIAWKIITHFVAQDVGDWAACNFAAGPLEDFISLHGSSYIEKIEELAKTDPIFRDLLDGVWQNSSSPEVWSRVEAARLD